MIAVKGTTVKSNFKSICDQIIQGEIFFVTRPREENIVMISAKEYNELERIRKNAEYLAKIDRAIEQKDRGSMQAHELIEV